MTAFVVHTLAQTIAVLSAATARQRSVTLLSAPSAATSVGSAYFHHMVTLARHTALQSRSLAVLDCGTATGLALAALHGGAEAILVAADEPVLRTLADIARQTGGILLRQRPHPWHDLAASGDPLRDAHACFENAPAQEIFPPCHGNVPAILPAGVL